MIQRTVCHDAPADGSWFAFGRIKRSQRDEAFRRQNLPTVRHQHSAKLRHICRCGKEPRVAGNATEEMRVFIVNLSDDNPFAPIMACVVDFPAFKTVTAFGGCTVIVPCRRRIKAGARHVQRREDTGLREAIERFACHLRDKRAEGYVTEAAVECLLSGP